MSNTNSYPHGTFSWADLRTTDGEAAKAFYTGVFGWEVVDNPIPGGGVYTMLQQDGIDVVALSEMTDGEKEQGVPPHWNSYITVDDVEAATAKAAELGATVMMPAMDVMDAGRMALIKDPTDAYVSLWQAKMHKGAGIFNVPNTMGWNELQTHDTEAAKSFYTTLFGWTSETDAQGYTAWMNNGRANGGMMQIGEDMGPVPANWGIYIAVEDCAATVAQITEAGGSVVVPPFPAGGVGTISVVRDPQGGIFSVIEMSQADTTLPGE
ncbi:MAG: VOC family protein [Chloroflexota bacterium]